MHCQRCDLQNIYIEIPKKSFANNNNKANKALLHEKYF